jgi:hypothetical protein
MYDEFDAYKTAQIVEESDKLSQLEEKLKAT